MPPIPQEMLLRIYWDGREKPDVEAPVGDFFANCFGKRMEVVSVPVIVEDADSYNCFWHMPFRKSARIEIVNQSKKPIRKLYNNVDWIKKKSLPENTMYFCAQYRQEYPATSGGRLPRARRRGQGLLRRHRLRRPHPQPVLVRRGRRDDLHRRRSKSPRFAARAPRTTSSPPGA